jgi:hypothetical protein
MANHVPFWIASDLLAQARAHGVELSDDFTAQLLGIVRGEQQHWMTDRREADDDRRRDERRRAAQQRGWF